jgi:phospholipid-binding lipoprotein MlaA
VKNRAAFPDDIVHQARRNGMAHGRLRRRPIAVAAAVLATALLLASAAPAAAEADPFEAVNRRVHRFNEGVRTWVLAPAAEIYVATVPAGLRRGVANLLGNLNEPIVALSGLAAGEFDLAANAAARFGINSTLGLMGVHDRAAELGYPRRAFAVADAVCRWGVPSGPFLMLPLLGPTTLRDAAARMATGAALSQALGTDLYLAWSGGDAFIGFAEMHRELERLEALALDPYAVQRSAYLQRRATVCPTDDGVVEPATVPGAAGD